MQTLDDLGAHVSNTFVVRMHSFNRLVHTPPKVVEVDLFDLEQGESFGPDLEVEQELLEAPQADPEFVADQTLHGRAEALVEVRLAAVVLENHPQVFPLNLIQEVQRTVDLLVGGVLN